MGTGARPPGRRRVLLLVGAGVLVVVIILVAVVLGNRRPALLSQATTAPSATAPAAATLSATPSAPVSAPPATTTPRGPDGGGPAASTAPAITRFTGPTTVSCASGVAMVTLSWSVRNAVGVILSIDNPNGPYGSYPATDTETVPFGCAGPTTRTVHTYYLTTHGGSGAAATKSITIATPDPTISSFTAPKTVSCASPPVMIALSWSTSNDTGVNLYIDGGLFASYPARDTESVPFGCNGKGSSHTYSIVTTGGAGPAATQKHTVVETS